MANTSNTPNHATSALSALCEGAVLQPGDQEYEANCAAWNLTFTQRPAVVVRAASEADVLRAVRHAIEHNLAIAVQTTGHGVAVPSGEASLLLAMGDLTDVRIDAASRTATIGGGATWAGVLEAAQAHGLAPLVGSSPHVGAVGYSLGGGFGWLGRRYGLGVDAIRSMRVVLGDGSVVVTSPSEHADLFWALCGTAGGTLGVVVEMTIDLFPVTEVYAGSLLYPIEDAREVFNFYREWSAQAPDDLTSAFNITAFPPVEIVPEPLRGETFAIVRGCFAGTDHAAATAMVDEWRQWKAPAFDLWGPMPFSRSAEISQDPVDPLPGKTSGRWLSSIGDDILDAMLAAIGADGSGPSPVLLTEVRHAGGAIRTPNAHVSYSARDVEYAIEIVGLVFSPEAGEDLERRFSATWERIAARLAPVQVYLNFVEGDERVRISNGAFAEETGARLASVKQQYDPHNRFRYGISLIR